MTGVQTCALPISGKVRVSAFIPENVNNCTLKYRIDRSPVGLKIPTSFRFYTHTLATLPDGRLEPYITTVEPGGIFIRSIYELEPVAQVSGSGIEAPAVTVDRAYAVEVNTRNLKAGTDPLTLSSSYITRVDSPTLEVNGAVRIHSTVDASETSTNHPFQIGPDSGVNARFDNNEVIYLNNGAYSPVYNWASEYVFYNGQIKANAGLNVASGELTVTGGSNLSGATTLNNGLTVTGDVVMNNNLAVTGTGTFTGNLRANSGFVANGINYGYSNSTTLTVSNTTNFNMYTTGDTIEVYRRGPWVTVKGTIKCITANYITGTSQRTFATLPSWAYPIGNKNESAIIQGSGSDTWNLAIGATNGNLTASRYSGTTQGVGVWMPFSVTYLAA